MLNINIPPMIPLEELVKRKSEDVKEKTLAQLSKTVQKKEHKLEGVSGVFKGAVFPISESAVLGRDHTCSAIIFPSDTPGISRAHCMLVIEKDGTVAVMDLDSTNGTFLADGTRCKSNVPISIKPGECFYLGSRNEMFCLRE